MRFFDRYKKICTERGIVPCAEETADLYGIKKSTISAWNTKNTTPKGDTVAIIADVLCVSTDYLLGRTDDPTDYSNPELIAEQRDSVMDHFDGDVRKAVAFQKIETEDALKDSAKHKAEKAAPSFFDKYLMLDFIGRAKAEAYIDGLLSATTTSVAMSQEKDA